MKKIAFPLLSILLVVFSSILVEAAPMIQQPSIALNNETNECGVFYKSGDESGGYVLPEDWKSYRVDRREQSVSQSQNKGYIIETSTGSCNFSDRFAFQDKKVSACCEKLGYTYVEGNVGVYESSNLGARADYALLSGILFCITLAVLVTVFGVSKFKTGSFIPFADKYPKKGLIGGFLFGLLTLLAYYGQAYYHTSTVFSTNIVTVTFAFFSAVLGFIVKGLLSPFLESSFGAAAMWPFDWIVMLIASLAAYTSIGWVVGSIIESNSGSQEPGD